MIKWFSKKKYPQFWKDYSSHFSAKYPRDLNSIRFVIFDTETTGLDIKNDKILSIGAVSVIGNSIDVADSFETYLTQDTFNKDTVEIHGILKSGNIKKIDEQHAVELFLEYINNAVLVAHHAAFDVAMMNQALKRMGLPRLKNKVLDTGVLFKKTDLCKNPNKHYSLDELCDIFNVAKHDRHTASGDAYITAIIMIKIIALLQKKRKIALPDLFINLNRSGLI